MRRVPWFFAIWYCLLPIAGFAQRQARNNSPVRDITLDVVVTDKAGTAIRGLQQNAFTLLDNKEPRALTSFRAVDVQAGTPAPYIEVVVVIDAINADPLKATSEREGVKKFFADERWQTGPAGIGSRGFG